MKNISPEAKALHESARVADLHAHPSLKIYLFNKKLYKRYRCGGAFNPLVMRVDFPKTLEGGVNLLFSSVYLPERGLLDDCWLMKLASYVAPRKLRNLFKGNPFEQANLMLDKFEQAVREAQNKGYPNVEIAYSLGELQRILDEGKLAVVHALEGAHTLDGKVENLKKFLDRGVCLLTLAHFYENGVAYPADGIPANMKRLGWFRKKKDLTKGLTELGRQVVEEMFNLGMIVDLTHATPKAREEVYEIHKSHPSPRPVIASHVGVKKYYDNPYNLSDEEIKTIAGSGGVIGVIFMNYWLSHPHQKYGLQYILDTLNHLRNVGGRECLAIGSDFDGFTDPPDDLKDISRMVVLTNALLQAGFSTGEVEMYLGKNTLRVLQDGWGKKQ